MSPTPQRHGAQQRELDLVAGQPQVARRAARRPWRGSPWPSSWTRRRRARCPRRARRPARRPARRASAARSARGSGRGRWCRPRAARASVRAAESSAARTLTFHGLGMNFVAMTTRLRTPGSAASSRPMMRSLSPLAVDLGGVEEDDAGLDAGLPGLADGGLGQRLCRSRPCPRCPCRPRPTSPRRAAGWPPRCRRARCGRPPAVAWRRSLRPAAAHARWASTAARHSVGMGQLGRVVGARDDRQPAVRHRGRPAPAPGRPAGGRALPR